MGPCRHGAGRVVTARARQGCGSLINFGKAEPRKNTTSPMFAHSMPVYYVRT